MGSRAGTGRGVRGPTGRLSDKVYGVPNVTGNSRLQSDVLEDLSDARRYRRWLADLARPYLGDDPIEIGSGTGDYAMEWQSDVKSFTATEADEGRYTALTQRFAHHDVVAVRFLLLGEPHGGGVYRAAGDTQHSAAVSLNVFEHIPDDVGALRATAALVRPGGAVILIVPAFPSAMSRFDLAIGHQRRYTTASMRAALTSAGLEIEQVRYVNPVGLLSWYATVKALRMTPHNGWALRTYDRTIVPLARLLDRLPIPFGQSVFAVARVPSGRAGVPPGRAGVPTDGAGVPTDGAGVPTDGAGVPTDGAGVPPDGAGVPPGRGTLS